MSERTVWETYEDAARAVVRDLVSELGLDSVEEKQIIHGRGSGTNWEIDGKGVRGDGYFVIEARRKTSSRVKQEEMAALAYRVVDVGADGGILVSPLPLQEGAEKVARAGDIEHIRLAPGATPQDYVARFLDRIVVRKTEGLSVSHSIQSVTLKKVVADDRTGGDQKSAPDKAGGEE